MGTAPKTCFIIFNRVKSESGHVSVNNGHNQLLYISVGKVDHHIIAALINCTRMHAFCWRYLSKIVKKNNEKFMFGLTEDTAVLIKQCLSNTMKH